MQLWTNFPWWHWPRSSRCNGCRQETANSWPYSTLLPSTPKLISSCLAWWRGPWADFRSVGLRDLGGTWQDLPVPLDSVLYASCLDWGELAREQDTDNGQPASTQMFHCVGICNRKGWAVNSQWSSESPMSPPVCRRLSLERKFLILAPFTFFLKHNCFPRLGLHRVKSKPSFLLWAWNYTIQDGNLGFLRQIRSCNRQFDYSWISFLITSWGEWGPTLPQPASYCIPCQLTFQLNSHIVDMLLSSLYKSCIAQKLSNFPEATQQQRMGGDLNPALWCFSQVPKGHVPLPFWAAGRGWCFWVTGHEVKWIAALMAPQLSEQCIREEFQRKWNKRKGQEGLGSTKSQSAPRWLKDCWWPQEISLLLKAPSLVVSHNWFLKLQ